MDTSNWSNTCEWKGKELKVAIFAACKILDNTYGDTMYLSRVMKASNVRVIAGYHETGPTHPTDTYIANAFFLNSINGGVRGGESVRSSWQTANELYSQNSVWATLCYKENGNQYYRIPGFPGNTYTAPSSSATVYRFWNSYRDPEGGQIIATALSNTEPLPLELTTEAISLAEYTKRNQVYMMSEENHVNLFREMNDATMVNVEESTQKQISKDFISETFIDQNIFSNAIETVGTVFCEEIDPETGAVGGTKIEIGKTFCYNNQYNGIKLINNFYKVATDVDGVYFVINNWTNLKAAGCGNTQNTSMISEAEARATLSKKYAVVQDRFSNDASLAYVPIAEGIYRLCYEILDADGFVRYIDCGKDVIVEPFLI